MVRDPSGVPVIGAQVFLGQAGQPGHQEVTTDREGKFSLGCHPSESYALRVHKDGFRDSTQTITLPSQTSGLLTISLVVTSDAGPDAAHSSDGMQFSDKPNFTVAGITDWTAAGGHGSDVDLRAAEALARDTRTLSAPSGQLRGFDPEMESRLRTALQKAPTSFQANHDLGAYCLRAGHFTDAILPLEKAHTLNANDYENSYQLARAYQGAGQLEKAKALSLQLLQGGERAELHQLLGDIEEQRSNALAAEREYEHAFRLDPNEQNYLAWGSELLFHRAIQPAIEVFTRGTRAFPKSERILAALGAALYASGAYEDAARRVCEASDLNPSDPQPYLFLGKMEQAAPDPVPCVEDKLARFVHDQPDNARANFYYAIAMVKADEAPGRSEQAEALLHKVVRFDPRFAEAYFQLGALQAQRGDWEGARKSYEGAIAADPGFPDAHFRLAQLYKRVGDPEKARQELRIFESVKQSDAAAVEQRRREIQQFVVVLKNPSGSATR